MGVKIGSTASSRLVSSQQHAFSIASSSAARLRLRRCVSGPAQSLHWADAARNGGGQRALDSVLGGRECASPARRHSAGCHWCAGFGRGHRCLRVCADVELDGVGSRSHRAHTRRAAAVGLAALGRRPVPVGEAHHIVVINVSGDVLTGQCGRLFGHGAVLWLLRDNW